MVESCGIRIRFFICVGSGIKVISSSARTPIFLALNGRRGGKARLEERRAGYNDGLADTANETWKEGRDRRPGDGRDERAGRRLLYPHLASFWFFSSQIMSTLEATWRKIERPQNVKFSTYLKPLEDHP